ncbi:hypothetical protein LEN26_017104 [Aphanomyces euteiches]|nr:hypothetical protein LEN26_017104 [Aphanomyces euteiches]KAH9111144.1 hypothetical protein AeMF1_014266 [Aphanomyces euteiches]
MTDPSATFFEKRNIRYEEIRKRYDVVVERDQPPAVFEHALRLFDPMNLSALATVVEDAEKSVDEETERETIESGAAKATDKMSSTDADKASSGKKTEDVVAAKNSNDMSVAASRERGPVAFNDQSTAGSTPSHKKTPTKVEACEISHPSTDRSTSSKKSMASFAIEPKKTTPTNKVGAGRKHRRSVRGEATDREEKGDRRGNLQGKCAATSTQGHASNFHVMWQDRG